MRAPRHHASLPYNTFRWLKMHFAAARAASSIHNASCRHAILAIAVINTFGTADICEACSQVEDTSRPPRHTAHIAYRSTTIASPSHFAGRRRLMLKHAAIFLFMRGRRHLRFYTPRKVTFESLS